MRTQSPVRIALLAPFEGRYREIGYNALYAAGLALAEAGETSIELLPVDDGGTIASAADRAHALTLDPLVQVVIVLGYDAADATVQQAFGDLPVIIVGNWLAEPQSEHIFILMSAEIADFLSETERVEVTEAAHVEAPYIGSDAFALEGFRALRDDFEGITIISSGSLPDDDFRRRYLESDPFAVQPGLLATTTYDAVSMAVTALHQGDSSRAGAAQTLATMTYQGINGTIHFHNGYWQNAPINTYRYTPDGELTHAEHVIE